jgi:hypothetical protein
MAAPLSAAREDSHHTGLGYLYRELARRIRSLVVHDNGYATARRQSVGFQSIVCVLAC